jgi:hypothetical protein
VGVVVVVVVGLEAKDFVYRYQIIARAYLPLWAHIPERLSASLPVGPTKI